jgi:NADH-quinone oxidoreductase subunit G
VPIALIGEAADLTYDYEHLGDGMDALAKLAEHMPAKAERPMIIVGQGALSGPNGADVLALLAQIAKKHGVIKDGWNGFNVLHTAAARVGGLDIGFIPVAGGKGAGAISQGEVDIIFNLGADELEIAEGAFTVYIGTHGDRGAHRADVILPGAAYTEKSATYVNTEGRPQQTQRGAFPPGEAKRRLGDHPRPF